MFHAILSDSSFWEVLLRLDEETAAEVQARGCPYCGAAIHSARYPRKPRGVARAVLGPHYEHRLSFCCSRDGCRRRTTPPSVRFLGRRVYLGAIVVLVSALSHGLDDRRVARLEAVFPVSRRTLQRWRRWWCTTFTHSAFWRAMQGRFAGALDPRRLPASLLERFATKDWRIQLLLGLGFLAPMSTSSSSYSMLRFGPQRKTSTMPV